MFLKKQKMLISSILISAMLTLSAVPIFAEEPPQTITDGQIDENQGTENEGTTTPSDGNGKEDVEETPQPFAFDININYFAGEKGEYSIAFTAMDEVPAFTELGFKVTFTAADVDDADFTNTALENSTKDILRGGNYITYKLIRENAAILANKTAFANATVKNATAAPSADNFTVSECYYKDATGQVITIEPTLTFQAGSIIPELTEKEQKAYDLVLALPDAKTLSFYKDGKLADLDAVKKPISDAKAAYTALTKNEKANVDAVLLFYGYSADVLAPLEAVVSFMESAKGLSQIAFVLDPLTDKDILKYQYMPVVFDAKKSSVSSTKVPEGALVLTEFAGFETQVADAKTLLSTTLETVDYDDLTYACADQMDTISYHGDHVYRAEYYTELKKQIQTLEKDIEKNFTGRDEAKNHLLDALNEYEASINLIQTGATDIPTMTFDELIQSITIDITFTRKKNLSSSIDASVCVIAYEDGVQADKQEVDFPSNARQIKMPYFVSAKIYDTGQTYTLKAYYILDDVTYPIATRDCICRYVEYEDGSSTGLNTGGLKPSTVIDDSSEDETGNGGTRFPSNEIQEEETEEVVLFHDLEGYDWAKEAIEGLYYAGVVNGMEEGVFNPAGLVTREQFAKMVVQLFGVATGSGKTNFVDVAENAWYAPYINAALQAGYIQGQSDEYFGVGESIMRQDMATILYRAIGDRNSKVALTFTDADQIAPYATDAVAELVGLQILNGYEDGSFKPRGTATRAEAAKAIWGVYQLLYD